MMLSAPVMRLCNRTKSDFADVIKTPQIRHKKYKLKRNSAATHEKSKRPCCERAS